MSLWTPDGERPVNKSGDQPAPAAAEMAGVPGLEDLSPEEQEQAALMAAEIAEARKQISEAPASMIVANHVMGLYELAAIHLGNQPPKMKEAAVAIDAMAAVVDALPGRLGENEAVLKEALAQLRMAYVQVSQATKAEDTSEEE